jgi:hypothetical protein
VTVADAVVPGAVLPMVALSFTPGTPFVHVAAVLQSPLFAAAVFAAAALPETASKTAQSKTATADEKK